MSSRDLDAAGITDPRMRASYERCRQLNAAHGKTYYLATLLLPPGKRPYVHALYGFARYADEIVDDLSSTLTDAEKSDWLVGWGEQFLDDLGRGYSDDDVCRAVVDTVLRWDIPVDYFTAFLHSMRMDLTVTDYADYPALYEYVYGSAAVIGLQMIPILEPSAPEAFERAKDLGVAFQLGKPCHDRFLEFIAPGIAYLGPTERDERNAVFYVEVQGHISSSYRQHAGWGSLVDIRLARPLVVSPPTRWPSP